MSPPRAGGSIRLAAVVTAPSTAPMPGAIVVLGTPGSPFGERLCRFVEGECFLFDLDAPLRGEPVTVRPDAVRWQGADLSRAGAVFVESSTFLWPQPEPVPGGVDAEALREAANADRDARSLLVSALRVVAGARPVVNDPATAHLAASPAVALAEVARAGAPVARWSLGPAPGAGSDAIVLDAAGPDLWHRAARPPEGEPALVVEGVAGEVTSVLVVGGEPAGARSWADARAWSAGEAGARGDPAPSLAAVARAAASALSLEVAEVALSRGGPAVLAVHPSPDLAGWDDDLGGRVAPVVAARLTTLAAAPRPREDSR